MKCNSLFAIDPGLSVDYNTYIKAESPKEKILRGLVRDRNLVFLEYQTIKHPGLEFEHLYFLFNLEKLQIEQNKKTDTSDEARNLKDAVNVLDDYYDTGRSLRGLSNDITKISFMTDFSKAAAKRFLEVEAGVILRAAEFLSAQGINYMIRTENNIFFEPGSENSHVEILIGVEGSHYINQLAKKMFYNNRVHIVISVRQLVEAGAAGMYAHPNEIILSPKVLLQDSIYQDEIVMHEYTHYLDFSLRDKEIDRPYHAWIYIKETDPTTLKKLGIYKKGFSVDELKAYRTSLRHNIHKALTTKSNTLFLSKYKRIQNMIGDQVTFSQVTQKVFGKYLRDTDFSKPRLKAKVAVKFNEHEKYEIEQEANHNAKATYEMAKFSSNFYSYLAEVMSEYSNKSIAEKRKLIEKIAKVMSIPEVKKLNGNYPAMDSIEKYFRD